jgi:hypothetical protein
LITVLVTVLGNGGSLPFSKPRPRHPNHRTSCATSSAPLGALWRSPGPRSALRAWAPPSPAVLIPLSGRSGPTFSGSARSGSSLSGSDLTGAAGSAGSNGSGLIGLIGGSSSSGSQAVRWFMSAASDATSAATLAAAVLPRPRRCQIHARASPALAGQPRQVAGRHSRACQAPSALRVI